MHGSYRNVSLEAIALHAQTLGMTASDELAQGLPTRITQLPRSPIRALLDVHRDENTLDLGGGIPCPSLFPSEALARLAPAVIEEHPESSLQYAPTEGLLPLRRWLCARLRARGMPCEPERLLITHGSQQALGALAQVVACPSRPVAFEQPGYPGARQAFALAQAPLLPLEVTEEGWDLSLFDRSSPASVYVVAHHHNPTGRGASDSSKQQLAALTETRGCFLIEDDAYAELDFTKPSLRPAVADAPHYGVLVGSLSKTLCPGLRLGFIVAPPCLVDPLVRTLQATSLQPGTLAQHLALALLESLDWDQHLSRLRSVYAERMALLSQHCLALGLAHVQPQGGFYLWVRTRGNATTTAQHLARQGVLTVPESAFRLSTTPESDEHLRLSFTRYRNPTDARLRQALASVPS
jgi:2-aminoadipate transaminase